MSKLEIVGEDGNDLLVKSPDMETSVKIEDTFAEMFPMWVGRFLITAATEEWALTSARAVTGFAVSIILSPAEAGIEKTVSPNETPDGRSGALIQIYHTYGHGLKDQMLRRLTQCVLTCPTTSVFDAMGKQARKKLQIGKSLSIFGDGFQTKDKMAGRNVWRIPVMEGEFIVEDKFGVKRGVAGGNLLILAEDQESALKATVEAVNSIRKVDDVVLTFPGGICRSGSKVGSLKYKLGASTNHLFCPTLKDKIDNSELPEDVNSVFEIVINGLSLEAVKKAMAAGIKGAVKVPGTVKITAANYGGKLGPYKAHLKELLN